MAPRLDWVLACTFCLLLAGAGCSRDTRLPSLYPSPGDTNPRSFTVHDPLPETDIAPDMAARPRGFMYEWSEPRRTQGAQAQLGIPPGGTNSVGPPNGQMAAPPGGPMGGPPVGSPVLPGVPNTSGMPVAPSGPGMPGNPYPPGTPFYPPGAPPQ